MALAAGKLKIEFPTDAAVDAEVDLVNADGAYFLQARFSVSLPGLEREFAQLLVDTAHQTCPYSRACRNNIDVEFKLV
jgi:organic hydroperoxide reductase OsmC/OhrA